MTAAVPTIRPESFLTTMVAPVRVDAVSGETTASTRASGFIWEVGGAWFLVTNIHVLTGWHHEKGRPLSSTSFNPTHLDFELIVDQSQDGDRVQLVGRVGRRVNLEQDGCPTWFEHPEFGPEIDVAVIPLFARPNGDDVRALGGKQIQSVPVNMHPGWTEFYRPSAADDAYVVGYPKGMSARGFPVWKRASIASDPELDVDKLPKVLVDTATREGMSGSPVIAAHRGFCSPTGEMAPEAVFGEVMKLLGVYSGRIGDDPLGVQLGIVWKAHVIDEIISGSKKGAWPWDRASGSKIA